jgi:hypothetical protein
MVGGSFKQDFFSGSSGTDLLSAAPDTSYDSEVEGRSGYGGCGCGCGQSYTLPFLLGALALATWFLNMQVSTKVPDVEPRQKKTDIFHFYCFDTFRMSRTTL